MSFSVSVCLFILISYVDLSVLLLFLSFFPPASVFFFYVKKNHQHSYASFVYHQLFVYASGAQYVLTYGEASSTTGRALAAGVGLTIAVYATLKTSGTFTAVSFCTFCFECACMRFFWQNAIMYFKRLSLITLSICSCVSIYRSKFH